MTRCESYPPCFGTIYFPTAPFKLSSRYRNDNLHAPRTGHRHQQNRAVVMAVCIPPSQQLYFYPAPYCIFPSPPIVYPSITVFTAMLPSS